MLLLDVVCEILSRLPVKSLLRFKCVCKLWNSLISDRNFALSNGPQRNKAIVFSSKVDSISLFYSVNCELATEELPFPKETSSVCRFLGACRSFLLIGFGTDIYMWNPSIRHCSKVLEMEYLENEWDLMIPGLCYNDLSDDYVAVIGLFHYTEMSTVLVASMKEKKWKKITFPYDLYFARAGPFMNERLHWIVRKSSVDMNFAGIDHDYATYLRQIFCPDHIIYFNPQTSEFDMLPTPEDVPEEQNILCLGVVDDCLSMVSWSAESGIDDCMRVMIMKDYGIKESWTTLFYIPTAMYNLKMLYLKENKEEALMVAEHVISVYDCVQERQRIILPKTCNQKFQAAGIIESLASPSSYRWDDRTHNMGTHQI